MYIILPFSCVHFPYFTLAINSFFLFQNLPLCCYRSERVTVIPLFHQDFYITSHLFYYNKIVYNLRLGFIRIRWEFGGVIAAFDRLGNVTVISKTCLCIYRIFFQLSKLKISLCVHARTASATAHSLCFEKKKIRKKKGCPCTLGVSLVPI